MLLASLVALSLSAGPATAPAAAKAPPKPFTQDASIEGITQYSLPNGLKVLFVPDPSKPTATVALTVFVGSRHENYGEKGMAHLFEHMLFKKTKKFPNIKEELTKLGGMVNGTTSDDRTNYFEAFAADDARVQRAIELEAERLRNAIISREQLATEMTVVRNEFEMGENRPMGVLMKRMASAAYQFHNYGNSTIGAQSDIENVPNEKLIAWYETYYQPDNAMLVVAGRFDQDKAFKVIGDTFGKMPKPKRVLPTTYTVEPTQDGEVSVTVRRVGGTPVVAVGYHSVPGSDPDSAPLDVLAHVLGDSPSGRVYKALVEPKKAARVFCNNQSSREGGFLFCGAMLQEKDSSAPARDALLATVEDFAKKPATKDEVERAKTALLKEFDNLIDDSTGLAISLSEFAAAGDWRLLFLSRDRLAAVTVDDVARVAGRYLKASNRTLGEYVPTAKPERSDIPPMSDLAPVLKDYKGKEAVAQGEAFDTSPKNIDERTKRGALANGMKTALLSKKTRGETVQVVVQLKYGTEKSLFGTRAANDFAAKMLMRGTKTKSRQQVKDLLDQLKAQVRVMPGPQGVTVAAEAKRAVLGQVLDLVAEMLKTPAFDATEFEQLRREALSEAELRKDDPNAIGQVGIQRMLSPFQEKGHPLYVPGWPEIIEDAKALKLEQVKDLHAKFYGAQSGYVAVVGDFDEKEVSDKLAALFGSWKGQQEYVRIAVPFKPVDAKVAAIETPDKKMAFFGAGTTFKMKDSDPDYPAMVMADYLLGGGMLTGRVAKRLREKEGLSYGAGTYMRVSGHDEYAAMLGYAIYAPMNVAKVENGFNEEIAGAVDKGFTDAELKLAREGIMKDREAERAEDGSLAMELVSQLDLGRTMAFEQQVDDKLKSLTLADVNATLKKYVDPKKWAELKVGDFKKVEAPK